MPDPSASLPTPQRQPRLLRWLLWGLSTVALAVLIDNLLYDWLGPRSIRGTDYLVVALAGGFLVAAGLWRNGQAKLTALALAVAVPLVLIELALLVAGLADGRASPWYVWQPDFTRLVLPENLAGVSPRGEFTTNSRGLRGPEFSDADDIRILCVGGSTTESLYLDDRKEWPRLLMDKLNDRVAPAVWVANAGRSGLNALDHATLVEHLAEAGMVDAWVVLCGGNDFGQRLRGNFEEKAARTWQETFAYRKPGFAGSLQRPFQRNLAVFQLIERVRERLKVATESEDGVVYQDVKAQWIDRQRELRKQSRASATLPDLDGALDSYERSLMRIITAAREKDKTVIFATQPTMWSDQMTQEQMDLCTGTRTPEGYVPFDLLAEGMERFNQRMIEVCDREGVVCIDLASSLPKTVETFYDGMHFNESGAESVAQQLVDTIAPMIESGKIRNTRKR